MQSQGNGFEARLNLDFRDHKQGCEIVICLVTNLQLNYYERFKLLLRLGEKKFVFYKGKEDLTKGSDARIE